MPRRQTAAKQQLEQTPRKRHHKLPCLRWVGQEEGRRYYLAQADRYATTVAEKGRWVRRVPSASVDSACKLAPSSAASGRIQRLFNRKPAGLRWKEAFPQKSPLASGTRHKQGQRDARRKTANRPPAEQPFTCGWR